jgi:hypothetical protein
VQCPGLSVTSLSEEKLVEEPKKEKPIVERKPFDQAMELLGKESLGGAIFKANIDITHPLGFGYSQSEIPVYKNNTVWLSPSENEYSTISKYAANPHIDGYISTKNLNEFMKNSASTIISPVGQGRVILFADNPVFRGSWYSTDRMLDQCCIFRKTDQSACTNEFWRRRVKSKHFFTFSNYLFRYDQFHS